MRWANATAWWNTWLQCVGQRQLHDETRIIQVLILGASYIRDFTVGIIQGWGQIRFIKYKYKYIFFRSFKYKYKYKYTGKNLIKYKYKYKYSSSNTNTNTNTQWGRDKIAAILQMTYWILYCKKIDYTFKFHWKLFPKVQSTISLHWFR